MHCAGSHDSYTSRNNSDSIRVIDSHHVHLPKLGIVKVRGLREIKGKILNATLTKETTGKWYLSLQYETEIRETYPLTGNTAGIDLGIHDFIVLSDGTYICNPKIHEKIRNTRRDFEHKISTDLIKNTCDTSCHPSQGRHHEDSACGTS